VSDLRGDIILTIERSGNGIRLDKATVGMPGRVRSGQRVVKVRLIVPSTMFEPTPIPSVEIRLDEALAAAPSALLEQMPLNRALTDDEAKRMVRKCPDCPHIFGLHDEGGVCRVSDCPCILPETVRAAERLGKAVAG
jgi:hypothetical protein